MHECSIDTKTPGPRAGCRIKRRGARREPLCVAAGGRSGSILGCLGLCRGALLSLLLRLRLLRIVARLALQEAGAFAIVLEMVISPVAEKLTAALDIPTIGIGAGPHTDGQVLVWLDAAGVGDWHPSFSKQFGSVGQAMTDAATGYVAEVKGGAFPSAEHTFDE